MASGFPTSIDSFTDPSGSDKLNSPAHASQHANKNDAIEKIEAKVGVNASAVTSSHDYILRKGLGINTESDDTTITFSMAAKNIHQVTLGGNRTLAVSNVSVGQVFLIRLVQDGTGSRTVTWWSTIKWPGGSAPTLSTTAADIDAFVFVCTGANVYDGYFAGFSLS